MQPVDALRTLEVNRASSLRFGYNPPDIPGSDLTSTCSALQTRHLPF